jgi:hypothetical protein
MNTRNLWSRILKVVGCIGMLVGTVDPLEGSLLILPGSGMIALGVYLGGKDRRTVLYWTWAFILIAVGVAALFGLSAIGVGWLMAVGGGVVGLVRLFKARRPAAHA